MPDDETLGGQDLEGLDHQGPAPPVPVLTSPGPPSAERQSLHFSGPGQRVLRSHPDHREVPAHWSLPLWKTQEVGGGCYFSKYKWGLRESLERVDSLWCRPSWGWASGAEQRDLCRKPLKARPAGGHRKTDRQTERYTL